MSLLLLLLSQFDDAPAQVVLPPAVDTATLWCVIYDGSGNHIGALRGLESVEIGEAINRLGTATVVLPAGSSGVDVATAGKEIGIWRTDEGEIFRGRISKRDTSQDESGVALLNLQIASLAEELRWPNLYVGFAVENVTPSSALTSILSGTSWTGTVTGAGYQNVAKQWDDQTLYQAIIELAQIANAYVRETDTLREIELKNTSADSGMRLSNLGFVGQSPEWGLISALSGYEEDATNLANRVVPFGKTDSDSIFDIRDSTRVSPYTISSVVARAPRPSGTEADDGVVSQSESSGGAAGNAFQYGLYAEPGINCQGHNRLLIVTQVTNSSSGSGTVTLVKANGQVMKSFLNQTSGSKRVRGWYLQNPKVGDTSIEAWYQSSGPPGDAVWGSYCIAGARQRGNPIRGTAVASGTSTGPTVAVTTEANDLVVDIMGASTNNLSVTPGAGQTALMAPNDVGTFQGDASREVATGVSTTMSWTLPVSVAWIIAAIAIRPAPTLYIEDSTSVTAYGRRVKMLPLGTFKPTSPEMIIESANTMYDAGVDYLLKHKDPQTFYDFDVAYLPLGPTEWLVGDAMRCIYRDSNSGIEIDDDLICVERTHSYDQTGTRHWALTLSTVAQMREDGYDKIAQLMDRVNAVQSNQV